MIKRRTKEDKKIIVENQTKLPMADVLKYVVDVLTRETPPRGVSTHWNGHRVAVYAFENEKSYRFEIVMLDERKKQ